MEIVDSKVDYWEQHDSVDHIARCARVCYASNKTTNNKEMCSALWKNKHRSMFRHAGVYYIIPEAINVNNKAFIGSSCIIYNGYTYVSANEQSAREYWDKKYSRFKISTKEAFNDKVFIFYKLLRVTICVETGIDITREYIAEQSTRYVDFNKKIGIRFKRCHWMRHINLWKKILVNIMCKTSEWFYKLSRSKYGLNLTPEDARWILPLDTMSKAVYTYTIKEWEEIINMRLWDWTGRAHPDAKLLASLIYTDLIKAGFKIEKYK